MWPSVRRMLSSDMRRHELTWLVSGDVLFVAESTVVADDGVHLVWVGVVTFYQALVVDHGRC
jgi:hypothetical protein